MTPKMLEAGLALLYTACDDALMGNYYETFPPPFYPDFDAETSLLKVNAKAFERPDQDIEQDLAERFLTLHGIDTSNVQVRCDRNVVHLTGAVTTSQVAVFLQNIAAQTLGVRDVASTLKVQRVGATGA